MVQLLDEIPQDAAGLRLCKIVGKDDNLVLCEPVVFPKGRAGVDTALRRACISGHVGGPLRKTDDYWADFLNADGDSIGEVRLDRESWNILKNKWMRCAVWNPACRR